MRVSGLDDKEMDNYFIAMMTGKEMRPSIEGSRQQGFCEGIKARAGQQGYRGGIKAGSGLRGAGIVGDCWSSSLYTVYSSYARSLHFGSDERDWYNNSRDYGFTVRPVRP